MKFRKIDYIIFYVINVILLVINLMNISVGIVLFIAIIAVFPAF